MHSHGLNAQVQAKSGEITPTLAHVTTSKTIVMQKQHQLSSNIYTERWLATLEDNLRQNESTGFIKTSLLAPDAIPLRQVCLQTKGWVNEIPELGDTAPLLFANLLSI